jgi:phosphoribosylanthranilate isomerase
MGRMSVQVKICGIRDAASAHAAEASADFAGLNLVPGARRGLTLELALHLRSQLQRCQPVLVVRSQPIADVLALAVQLNVPWVQLHGDEPLELADALRSRGRRVVKAVSPHDSPEAHRWLAHVDALLVDAPTPGSGAPWNWQLAPGFPRELPLWLAGGLHAGNVAHAILHVQPDVVDAASGVEVDGAIRPSRIAAFTEAARELSP